MTIKQLHAFCQTRGIKGYSKLRKADIITHIESVLFNRHFKFDSDLFSDSRERKLYTPHEVETAFESRLKTYDIQNEYNLMLPEDFLNNVSSLVRGLITKHLKRLHGLKVNFLFLCDYERGKGETMIEMEMNFKTQNEVILESTDLVAYYRSVIQKLRTEMEEFVARGSGWTLVRIKSLEVRINKYNPLKGSSYIDLPKKVKAKKAVLNVQNEDEKCFMWAILSALHPAEKDGQRVTKYKPYEEELKFEGIEFPVKMEDRVFARFEKMNSVSVNIYSYEGNDIYPLRITKNKEDKHINLLYIKNKEGNSHYCWIKDLSKLISGQVTKHNGKVCVRDACCTITPKRTSKLMKRIAGRICQ